MAFQPITLLLSTFALFLFFSTPVAAFGAGSILKVSAIAGKNWRHGDIEDVLLELMMSNAKEFDSLSVKRVYFGNWLRDYSQALDVGGLSKLPKDTIRTLLWILSFLTFGYATGEFEVTEEKLGVYRPEEHIDNPKDYADNEDARVYDERLRAPVDEEVELAIDPQNGMKAYIASEHLGIDTSAGLVRKVFKDSINKAREYADSGDDSLLFEALRQLGTGLHCIEANPLDYSAHSNYIELALRELGVDAFPHVGDATEVEVQGKTIFPLVTGTFGMTDFLHSVVGEVTDKMYQSEIQQLDDTLNNAQQQEEANSRLKEILDQIPMGLLGSDNPSEEADNLKAAADEERETHPNQTIEDIKNNAAETIKKIYPILEFHDRIMKGISQAIDKVPFLSGIIENLSGALQIYIFSLLAPYIMPILKQAREELKAGSTGILSASEAGQYIVFNDDSSHNPTHSMLSKDHFTNILNPVAGQIAQTCVRFAVPKIVEAWQDRDLDPDQVIDDILQVFHHPALRDESKPGQSEMFRTVAEWWEQQDQDDFAARLSKEGVRNGDNHEGEDGSGAPGGKSHSHGGCAHHHQSSYGQDQGGYSEGYEAQENYGHTDNGYGGGHGGDGYGGESAYEQPQQQDNNPVQEIVDQVESARKLMGMFGF
ncbi:heterokaryon incompatibility Het-C [Ascobolus immersus RN42]|uniref:Heterokaryon incompatibility Het-C n=1 Tax=Ascobolus immersus RN42 TaxID=1160509 RepID=A0A3N4HSC2_ASCIM|nr:heterokaryon incompatibility Het-C [Ascobolus immersus RN42]